MLQIKQITKRYKAGNLSQTALNGVDLSLRQNEFVAILGPSGSGKTTLLNIIGGLDSYDSGDLIIKGKSTKKYGDRDWDSYRNHTIGFVFQSYNLIPHQSVLANVELALTISGVSRKERKRRALEALTKVGLEDHVHKRPNQMSGGQMQRVAIARALINNPAILLADEPTGAIDSETSVQIMDLLKEVARDRLVIMVTHNTELAEEYATRIVRLADGQIIADTNPHLIDSSEETQVGEEELGTASMSFITALVLSFNNLGTKKARTILTAFAGSIGIIGIALILAISTGLNDYIVDIQRDTMVSYPITIEAQAMDISGMIQDGHDFHVPRERHELDGIYTNSTSLVMANRVSTRIKTNNLTAFKQYLEDNYEQIQKSLGPSGIIYTYNVQFDAYAFDPEGVLVKTDGSSFSNRKDMGMAFGSPMVTMGSGSANKFAQLMPGNGDQLVSDVIMDNYQLLYGDWPRAYDEVILVVNRNNEISITTLYELGFLPANEYETILEKLNNQEEIEITSHKWDYEDVMEQKFYLIPAADYYVQDEVSGLFTHIGEDKTKLSSIIEDGLAVQISGVVRLMDDPDYSGFSGTIGYTQALTDYLITYTRTSPVVQAQKESPRINIINGLTFDPQDDATKVADAIAYLSNLDEEEKGELFKNIVQTIIKENPLMARQLPNMDQEGAMAALDGFLENPSEEILLLFYDRYISAGNYDANMKTFGLVSLDAPAGINIYPDSFEAKDAISDLIASYNQSAPLEDQIVYTDFVALIMSSVTRIINVISYILIAFVGVSLVVSSIMIGIITYISVLERTKEIGILRAIGASKGNIAQVFNAETFIVGLLSGIIGVGITVMLLIPGNTIIHRVTKTTSVNASLPIGSGIILIVLSIGLTLIAGLIPSRKAAEKDPVIALRTE